MIKYKLVCKKCEKTFDSWFASSKEYEKLKKKNYLNCYNCNSKEVEKSIMAPKIMKKEFNDSAKLSTVKLKKINRKIKEYQKFIEKNFEYVGENFTYEARSIHYDSKKKSKGIYGLASVKELGELKEEGIKTEIVPWIDDKSN